MQLYVPPCPRHAAAATAAAASAAAAAAAAAAVADLRAAAPRQTTSSPPSLERAEDGRETPIVAAGRQTLRHVDPERLPSGRGASSAIGAHAAGEGRAADFLETHALEHCRRLAP